MLLPFVSLIGGLFILVKAAGYLVDGASALARRIGVSPLVVGLTVVAFGTSAPELTINVVAALKGTPEIAVGNVLGSNLVNILLILGASAVIRPVRIEVSTVWKQIPLMLLGTVMVFILASDVLFDSSAANVLTPTNGLALLGFFSIFLYYTISIAKHGKQTRQQIKQFSGFILFVLIVGGLAGLVLGGNLVVNGAVGLATSFGIADTFIALTIVAIGTSLPELATAIVAARRGQDDIVVGGLVGSNIFNTFFILGISSIITPLPFTESNRLDAGIGIIVSILLFVAMFIGKRRELERWQGLIFIGFYLAYLIHLFLVYV